MMRSAWTVVLVAALFGCSQGQDNGGLGVGGADTVGDVGSGNGSGGGGFQVAEALGAEVNPTAISFGVVPMGTIETRTLEVFHSGTSGVLELSRIAYESDAGTDLIVDAPPSASLGVGETLTIEVRYGPTDAVLDRGYLLIDTNALGSGGAALSFSIPIDTTQLSASLISDKAIVAFGGVPTATTDTRAVQMLNVGSLEVTVESVTVEGDSAAEFQALVTGTLPAQVAPGAEFPVEVSYSPVGQDTDTSVLRLVYSAADGTGEVTVPVSGNEISSEFIADPNPLDFGLRSPGTPHVEVITLTSGNSQVPLEVSAVSVTPTSEWSGTVTVAPWSEDGVVIGADESVEVEVTFTPDEDMVWGPNSLAEIAFETNDPTQGGVQTVPVFGQRGGTGLEVHPPDVVYFGYVGLGATVHREVTLYNAGNSPITVENIYVEGDYGVDDGESWPPTSATPEPAALAPGELRAVSVKFTHAGGLFETDWGKLVILSDDAARPTWEVLLNAQKVEGGDCLVQFVPSALDYGLTTPWTQQAQTLLLVNIGSGVCAYHSAITDDCGADGQCELTPDDEMAGSTSEKYSVTGEPLEGASLEPGEMVPIEITFTAPEAGPVIAAHPGMVRARVTSVSTETGEAVVSVHPSASSWLQIPNLLADVGSGQLEVTPPELDFQLVEIGCISEPKTVTGTNVGQAYLDITGWWLEGCTEEVTVIDGPDPDIIATVQVGESVTWTFDYTPVDDSEDACTLVITSSDSLTPTEVPVLGMGAYPAQVVDLFTDSESQKVDVLFVVDDSGSMQQEQANLSSSFQAFIYEAATWDSDYQIGVTTTTVSLLELSGGALYGSPPWVNEGNWEKFVNIVEVGLGGSGTEQGIWAAFMATSSPLIDDPEDLCEVNTDCGLKRVCVDGMCQGVNAGFLRDEAALEIVFVSDEEDQSPAELEEYLNHFRAIKGYDHPELLHMHAIVGPPGGCSSSNGSADAGLRYMNMAQATGGAVYSICELDFAKGLEGIGEIAFAAKMEYILTQTPAPTTISVTIEGLPCPAMTGGIFNWLYDADDNTVTLTEEGICIAGPGDEVLIAYDLLCYAEAD